MPTLTAALAPEGAVVAARIGWSGASAQSLRAAHRPVPPPVDVRALIDCGAESSCVDPSIIRSPTAQQLREGVTFISAPARLV